MPSSLIDIVVFLDAALASGDALAWATATAEEHGARLIGDFIPGILAASRREMFACGSALRDVIAAGEERLAHARGHSPAERVSHARYGDLAVVAFSRSPLREWAFGGVTRIALAEATLPVLLCR